MKKIILTFAAVIAFGAANAQYKSKAGDVTVDFGFTGGISNTAVSLPDQAFGNGAMFKARMFKSDKMALRGLLFLGSSSSNDKSASTSTDNVENKVSNSGFGIGVGVEKHFTGTDRLDTYVGGDFIIGFDSTKNTITHSNPSSTWEQKGPNGFRTGVRGVFGADYYFAKRVYVGVEAGLGIFFKSTGKTKTTAGGTTTETQGGSSFSVAPSVITGLKLGYAF